MRVEGVKAIPGSNQRNTRGNNSEYTCLTSSNAGGRAGKQDSPEHMIQVRADRRMNIRP